MIYLVDTGPLVSAFARREDRYKAWSEEILARVPVPVVTCEAVIVEATHFLGGSTRLLEAMEKGILLCRFDLQAEAVPVRQLMDRYADRPMDFADACLVRLYESYPRDKATLITVDRADFAVYRAHGTRPIRCEFPPL